MIAQLMNTTFTEMAVTIKKMTFLTQRPSGLSSVFVDEFELANPLGTLRKKHNLYWVLANLPSKYRSSLQSIQLAILCRASTEKQHGYTDVLRPFVQDLETLEQHGVYIEQLGDCVKGTVLFVSSDNLGAHSLAGLQESFTVEHPCQFCFAKRR